MSEIKGINKDFASAVGFAAGACFYTNFNKDAQCPTSAAQKMSELAGWESLGEPDQVGMTEEKKSENKFHKGGHLTNFIALGGTTEFTFKASFLETARASVTKLRYGVDAVEVNEDGSFKAVRVKQDAGRIVEVPLVIDFLESTTGNLLRYVIKRAAVSGFDTLDNKPGEPKKYGFTFTALDTGDGSAYIEIYRAKPVTSVSSLG